MWLLFCSYLLCAYSLVEYFRSLLNFFSSVKLAARATRFGIVDEEAAAQAEAVKLTVRAARFGIVDEEAAAQAEAAKLAARATRFGIADEVADAAQAAAEKQVRIMERSKRFGTPVPFEYAKAARAARFNIPVVDAKESDLVAKRREQPGFKMNQKGVKRGGGAKTVTDSKAVLKMGAAVSKGRNIPGSTKSDRIKRNGKRGVDEKREIQNSRKQKLRTFKVHFDDTRQWLFDRSPAQTRIKEKNKESTRVLKPLTSLAKRKGKRSFSYPPDRQLQRNRKHRSSDREEEAISALTSASSAIATLLPRDEIERRLARTAKFGTDGNVEDLDLLRAQLRTHRFRVA